MPQPHPVTARAQHRLRMARSDFLKKYQSLGFACRLLTFYFWFKLKPNKHCCWCQIKWHSCLRLLSRPLFWPFALAARWKSCRQRGSPGKWERKIETLVEDLCGSCGGFTVEDLSCESGRVLQCQWQKLACSTRPRMNHALHVPSVLDYSHFIKQGRGHNTDCEGCVSHPDCLREHSIAWRIVISLKDRDEESSPRHEHSFWTHTFRLWDNTGFSIFPGRCPKSGSWDMNLNHYSLQKKTLGGSSN